MTLNKLPDHIEKAFQNLRAAARAQRQLSSDAKNRALKNLAKNLVEQSAVVLTANQKDLESLAKNTTPAFRDRLTLTSARIKDMAESLLQVAALPDPVSEIVENRVLDNGLKISRVRAPLGVIFMIFESRPNVILEAFSLAFKSGNVIALRGGHESKHSSHAIFTLMRNSLKHSEIAHEPFFGFDDYDRSIVEILLKRKDLIDITVPRGGDRLIEFVQNTAAMPIIKNDRGLCHTYVEEDADLEMAAQIVFNAKTSRPGVCNALETVLVHEKVAKEFLPKLHKLAESTPLEWHADKKSLDILKDKKNVKPAKPEDWDTEYLDLYMNCKVVADLDEALTHIEKHGSKHSEAIVTKSETKARRFQQEVDAAAVYWNASTRFTDGFCLGLGGELGISTQKLHVRGPVGLKELTTARWILDGTGQIRK